MAPSISWTCCSSSRRVRGQALDCCQALLDLLELGAKRGVVGAQPVEAADIFGEMLAVPLDGAVFPAITTRGVPPAPEK